MPDLLGPLTPELVWGLFTRGLGVVFLISFASLAGQIVACAGPRGGVPIGPRLAKMAEDFPTWRRFYYFPTLLWLNSSAADLDAFRELQEGPNEIVELDPAFIDKAQEVTRQWADEQAAQNPWFEKVLQSQRDFKNKLKAWDEYRLPIGSLAE